MKCTPVRIAKGAAREAAAGWDLRAVTRRPIVRAPTSPLVPILHPRHRSLAVSSLVRVMLALALLALPSIRASAQATAAGPASDREQVLATIDTFLRGLRTKDSTLMMAQMDTLTRLTLLRPDPNGGSRVMVMSGADFIRAVTRAEQPAIDEPVRNPVVQVDGDLATVWAEYQVIIEGRVSHCGHDAFHLARLGGRWKILNVSDTFRRTGCGERWPSSRD